MIKCCVCDNEADTWVGYKANKEKKFPLCDYHDKKHLEMSFNEDELLAYHKYLISL